MSRLIVVAIFVACALASTAALKGPRSLGDVFTRQWTQPESEEILTAGPSVFTTEPTISFITQRVDNYNPQNNATFQQRFFALNQYYRPGGPLYVIIGALGPASAYEITNTLSAQLARSEYGNLFLLEHRFYGESIPTDDLSTENLRFLTAEQALADAANFVQYLKETVPGAADSPVIVSGRHYGGSLAVWFRQRYPHLSAGAWASSSPLQAQRNQKEYKVLAAQTIRQLAGDACYNTIESGFAELEEIALAGRLTELSELFNVCEEHPLEHDNDVATLFLIVSEYFSLISTFRPRVPQFCAYLAAASNTTNNPSTTPGRALASVIQNVTEGTCLQVDYDLFIRLENIVELDTPYSYLGYRAISYQMCTQLGWFYTSESPDQPFGSFFPLSFYTQICTTVFGEEVAGHEVAQYNESRFNVEHGGLQPAITNALFTHGSYDPNRSLEVTENLSETAVALQIPDGGFAYDFYQVAQNDPQTLIDSKLDVMTVIRSWTNQ